MQLFNDLPSLRAQVAEWRGSGQRIGFVPTMGNLHRGHFSLVDVAKQTCDRVLVSVFVNPTQFGPHEDFDAYPRTLDADMQGLQSHDCDGVFAPAVGVLYPNGQHSTWVRVDELTGDLDGTARPGHFDGVATVVTKLLQAVMPDQAFFGEKDYQQLLVIRRLVEDLLIPVDIIGCPTVREPDGLAMSSRNQYLKPEERRRAAEIYQTLLWVRDQVQSGQPVGKVCEQAASHLQAQGMEPDYVEVRRAADLKPLQPGDIERIVLVAVNLGSARLIDNMRWTAK